MPLLQSTWNSHVASKHNARRTGRSNLEGNPSSLWPSATGFLEAHGLVPLHFPAARGLAIRFCLARSAAGRVFVEDSAGARSAVAGAKVTLSGPAIIETKTDEDGNFSVSSVPSGTYQVEAVAPGLAIRQTMRVEATEIRLLLHLKPAEVTSSVVVKADQSEAKDPAPSETVTSNTLREAPNRNERFESALPLIPGVVRGPDGRVNLKGSRNTQSGALVNSANVTDPVTGGQAINLPEIRQVHWRGRYDHDENGRL